MSPYWTQNDPNIKSHINCILTLSTRALIQLIPRGGGDICPSPLRFLGKKWFSPNSYCTPKELPKIGLHTKKQVYIPKNKKWRPFENPASKIWRSDFVNILHFLPLRTKMALYRPILELDL